MICAYFLGGPLHGFIRWLDGDIESFRWLETIYDPPGFLEGPPAPLALPNVENFQYAIDPPVYGQTVIYRLRRHSRA